MAAQTTQSATSAEKGNWNVVWAAFVLATLGWGIGFYSPPIFLHQVIERTNWSLPLVSTAVTVHFLVGTLVVAKLNTLHDRLGIPAVTIVGATLLALGVTGWALCNQPWQLFAAATLTGIGWVTMGAAAINAIISPWFDSARPKALSTAYNGASVGGIIMAPLWIALINWIGFAQASVWIGLGMVAIVAALSLTFFAKSPLPAAAERSTPVPQQSNIAQPDSNASTSLWKRTTFITLAAGMALGLFAQIGLLAHLFSILAPLTDPQTAGIVMAGATASAIAGRTAFGWLMPQGADRRSAASLSYAVQIAGSVVLAAGTVLQSPACFIIGVLMFGFGIGNATSLPPLIAQMEFEPADAKRVVPMIVAIGQATYAFAPAIFGALRTLGDLGNSGGSDAVVEPTVTLSSNTGSLAIFAAAALIQMGAILCFLLGRKRRT